MAGQFVRVLLNPDGEFIPFTLADWDVRQGSIDLVIQGVGTSTKLMNSLATWEVLCWNYWSSGTTKLD